MVREAAKAPLPFNLEASEKNPPKTGSVSVSASRRRFMGGVNRIRLIIPDASVLTTLASEDRLDLLLTFTERVRLVVTNVVELESTHKTDLVAAQRIRQFLDKNANQISIQPTNFGAYLGAARQGNVPDIPGTGQLSIYGLLGVLDKEVDVSPEFLTFVTP